MTAKRDPGGRLPPSRTWLHEHYVVQERSAQQLAQDTGWSSQYIRDRLREAGIALRPAGSQGTKAIHLDRDTLTAMLGQGMTVAAIADRAGYGRRGVHKRLRKYGLPSPGPARVTHVAADPLVAECARMYRQGHSPRAIGAQFGHGEDWARARVVAAGVPVRRRVASAIVVDQQALRDALADGATVADLAAQFDRSQWAVRKLLRQAGLTPPPPKRRARALPLLDAELLRRLYVDEGLIVAEIAARLDVAHNRVRSGLVAAGIPRQRGRRRDDVITAAQLQELYVERQLSVVEVGDRLGVSENRVRSALRRHGIALRPAVRVAALAVDEQTLRRMYVEEGLDDDAIAVGYGVPTDRVRRRRRALGVAREPVPPPHRTPPAAPGHEQLRRWYCDQGRTLIDIAHEFRTSRSVVRGWLLTAGIEVRERTNRAHRRQLDVDLLRVLYEEREWTAAEIAAELDAPDKLVLRTLHDNGIPVRRGGSRRRLDIANEDAEHLIAALYDDSDVRRWLLEHHVPVCRKSGAIAERFPQPVPLTEAMLGAAYVEIGLSARHIELLTGQPHEQILDALHGAGFAVRQGGPSPWLRRRLVGAPGVP